jgi:hypothetical protein
VQAVLLSLVLLGSLVGQVRCQVAPAAVDLRPLQTPLKFQGTRAICMVYSTLGALEAAYKRAGYGDLELSVEFAAYMVNTFTLLNKGGAGPNVTENKLATAERGYSQDYVGLLARGFAVPLERVMPYKRYGYSVNNPPVTYWNSQFNVNSFNLDPRHLPSRALNAANYYSARSYAVVSDPTSPAVLEQILAKGHEIVWDFRVSGNRTGKVWQYTGPSKPTDEAHSMLLVGYDRNQRHFLVKNSWSAHDYTYISYDYVKYAKGYNAVYITGVNPPRRWPSLAFLGRWYFASGSTRGLLDIYHLPEMSQLFFEKFGVRDDRGNILQDRRLGTFYENGDPRRAYRVNGIIRGKRIVFYIDRHQPSLGYDRLEGKRYFLTLDDRSSERMTGDGSARKLYSTAAFKGNDQPVPLNALPEVERLSFTPRAQLLAAR